MNQTYDFRLDTGEENITNASLEIANSTMFFIEANYSTDGIMRTGVVVNTSQFVDFENGVMVR